LSSREEPAVKSTFLPTLMDATVVAAREQKRFSLSAFAIRATPGTTKSDVATGKLSKLPSAWAKL
jgi:RNA:NAD 2'-phosphotransferase (TPT1/KptA family)